MLQRILLKYSCLGKDRKLLESGLDARIVLQIHDELLVEAREDCAEQVRQLLQDTMKQAADLAVPLEVDAHIGKSWLEAH